MLQAVKLLKPSYKR